MDLLNYVNIRPGASISLLNTQVAPGKRDKTWFPERCPSEIRNLAAGWTGPGVPEPLRCWYVTLLTWSGNITEPTERGAATGDYDSASRDFGVRFRRRVRDVQFIRRRLRAVRRYVLIKTASFLKRVIFLGWKRQLSNPRSDHCSRLSRSNFRNQHRSGIGYLIGWFLLFDT